MAAIIWTAIVIGVIAISVCAAYGLEYLRELRSLRKAARAEADEMDWLEQFNRR